MNAQEILESLDRLEARCPKLGHQVAFGYCRTEGSGLPCPRALSCWQARFPAEMVLRHYLSPADWDRIFAVPPPGRMDSLLQAIDRAQENAI